MGKWCSYKAQHKAIPFCVKYKSHSHVQPTPPHTHTTNPPAVQQCFSRLSLPSPSFLPHHTARFSPLSPVYTQARSQLRSPSRCSNSDSSLVPCLKHLADSVGFVLPHFLGFDFPHSLNSVVSFSRSQLRRSLSPNTIGLTQLVKVSVKFITLICN